MTVQLVPGAGGVVRFVPVSIPFTSIFERRGFARTVIPFTSIFERRVSQVYFPLRQFSNEEQYFPLRQLSNEEWLKIKSSFDNERKGRKNVQ